MNWGVMLARLGRIADSQAAFDHAALMTEAPHIRSWDVRLMRRDLAKNQQALAEFVAILKGQ